MLPVTETLITQRSVVQIHPPQPNLPFGFNGLSQSHNWLGDSKPNFPAQILGFLYAEFYATPVKGTRFGILVLRAPFSWELPFGSGQAAAARLARFALDRLIPQVKCERPWIEIEFWNKQKLLRCNICLAAPKAYSIA